MANARERLEREAEARAADLAARKGAMMRRMMVSQLYCPEKVQRLKRNFITYQSGTMPATKRRCPDMNTWVCCNEREGMVNTMIHRPAPIYQVERAFERDWAKLCHPVMQPIDK